MIKYSPLKKRIIKVTSSNYVSYNEVFNNSMSWINNNIKIENIKIIDNKDTYTNIYEIFYREIISQNEVELTNYNPIKRTYVSIINNQDEIQTINDLIFTTDNIEILGINKISKDINEKQSLYELIYRTFN